ncbi:MAG: hypothetical protein AMXMBFR7_22030 [Planctomycetota bacterium]|nr:DUF58 domain-containing protein [Planctomycetota bacterium]
MGKTSSAPESAAKRPALSKYLDPRVLNRVDKLELNARRVVEGFMAGGHRSPFHGFSVEFAQHREYAAGDDPRHLDWKLFAKAGRYFVKQYEVETNYVAYVLHDASESMLFGSPRAAANKLDYANHLTAALCYLIVRQTDSVGVGIFNEGLASYIEPKQSFMHIHRICHELENTQPLKKTDTGGIMHEFAERIKKRGLVIVISDLLDDPAHILDGLNHLHFARHEVLLFHIMDPYELEFPFDGLIKFEGLEGYEDLLCQPRMLRKSYLQALNEHILAVRGACERNRVDYVMMNTAHPLEVGLQSFLQSRALQRVSHRG